MEPLEKEKANSTAGPACNPAWAGRGTGSPPGRAGRVTGLGRPGSWPGLAREPEAHLTAPARDPAWAGLEAGSPPDRAGQGPGLGR